LSAEHQAANGSETEPKPPHPVTDMVDRLISVIRQYSPSSAEALSLLTLIVVCFIDKARLLYIEPGEYRRQVLV